LSPGPRGENFSGSCIVTSRNPLIHDGATTATKSERFDAEGVPPCCGRALTAASERLLATVNFRESDFSTHFVNKGVLQARSVRWATWEQPPPTGQARVSLEGYPVTSLSVVAGFDLAVSNSDSRKVVRRVRRRREDSHYARVAQLQASGSLLESLQDHALAADKRPQDQSCTHRASRADRARFFAGVHGTEHRQVRGLVAVTAREKASRAHSPVSWNGSGIGAGPVGRLLSEIMPERVDWLWPGRIPRHS
jgi:hypothetical protein